MKKIFVALTIVTLLPYLLMLSIATAESKTSNLCVHVNKVIIDKSGTYLCTKSGKQIIPKKVSTKDLSPKSNGNKVSAETIRGKVLAGYQGWFACPTDDTGPTWVHWFDYGKKPIISDLTVDFWPDTSEYSKYELCPTQMKSVSGKPMMAYSGYNPLVVNRHFSWMQQYNIDGAAFQRFVSRMSIPELYKHDVALLHNVTKAAEKYGRIYYFEYDLNGDEAPEKYVERIKSDWIARVDEGTTSSKAYIHEKGLPVVEIWGVGLPGVGTLKASHIRNLIEFFKNPPNSKYRATVAGGVGSYWRAGTGDGSPGEEWAAIYRSFDILNPWSVGRYGSIHVQEAQTYLEDVVIGDIEETNNLGIIYLPVIWPGSSWTNLQRNRGNEYESNMMPRFCGSFYWQQAANVINAGAKQIFIAMFDEVDEGTAMYKMVTSSIDLPKNSLLLPLDVDGCLLNNDFYLRLSGATTKAIREGAKITRELPIILHENEDIADVDFTRGLEER